ncbi:hypothetical protein BWP39_02690 [Paraburkholderia acidicola]|uniref:Uncharacterized protein n=1 Tax=Paraburkholderia acidicola TaxID=1912599 RepID=A0A2A4F4B2_9BURK|nr:hypothetical protein [Paraburkholderia acidicola]PCE27424.1 hypothetical protein BWP39_02690 [Paraburkholderia acidicola]
MKKTTSTLIAAVAALALSGGAYAQNNTLARPTVTSPAAAANTTTSGYGTSGVAKSDSGTGSQNAGLPNSATSLTNIPGSHNTLATPGVASPAQ